MAVLVANPTPKGPLWLGDFQYGSGVRSRVQYPNLVSAPPGSWPPNRYQQNSGGPWGPVGQNVTMLCEDADVFPITPTANPRAQINNPAGIVTNGQTARVRGWVRFNYQPVYTTGFYLFFEAYQAPFTSVTCIGWYVQANTGLIMMQNASLTPHQTLWTTAFPALGTWQYFDMTCCYSTNPGVGFINLSYASDGTDNAVQQQLNVPAGGTTPQLTCQTIITGGTGMTVYLGPYRTAGLEAQSMVDYAGWEIDV